MSEANGARQLHEMLGLGRHTSVSELRYAYEHAMGRATRAGDYEHARKLSRAFDDLSRADRDRVFVGGVCQIAAPTATMTRSPERRNRPPRIRRNDKATWRRRARGVATYVLMIPGIVAIAIFTALHVGSHSSPRDGVYSPAPAPAHPRNAGAVTSPAQSRPDVGPTLQIPLTARTGANGMASVLCQPGPGGAGYYMTAPPGALVACTNGAVPYVLG